MKTCPYCFSDIVEQAIKCKHCGEWFTEKPSDQSEKPSSTEFRTSISSKTIKGGKGFFESDNLDNTLNEGVKMYAKFKIAGLIIGAILFLIFLFAFFIPSFNRSNKAFDNFHNSSPFKDMDIIFQKR